jgi:hypothetical protein
MTCTALILPANSKRDNGTAAGYEVRPVEYLAQYLDFNLNFKK